MVCPLTVDFIQVILKYNFKTLRQVKNRLKLRIVNTSIKSLNN